MRATLLKERLRDRAQERSRVGREAINVIDLVDVLQKSLGKTPARKAPGRLISCTVRELKNKLAFLIGQAHLEPKQHFTVEVVVGAEGEIHFRYFDRERIDQTPGASKAVNNLKTAEGGAYTNKELQAELGLGSALQHRRRKEHRIVSWRDPKHRHHYPKWQFNENGALWDGIEDVLKTFQSDDEWRVMRYFLSPRKQLGNETPLALLRAGQKDDVIAHAKAHAEENTW